MRPVHALRLSAAKWALRTRAALKQRRAPQALPRPDAKPAVIARSLEAHAETCAYAAPEECVDTLCETALAHHPGEAAIAAAAAHWFLVTGRPEQAVLACEEAFGHNAAGIGHDHAVQAAWGEALLVLDRAREAAWHLKAACGTAGASPDDWVRLAQACCRGGRYEEALEAAQRALQRPWAFPNAVDDAAATMAAAHYCLGQMAEAEGILEDLVARSPRHAEGRRLLKKVRGFMGKGIRHDS